MSTPPTRVASSAGRAHHEVLDHPKALHLAADDVAQHDEPQRVHREAHPVGVPVSSTSPGSSVIPRATKAMSSATVNSISFVEESCRSSSLTHERIASACGSLTSSAVVSHGPMGQKVSKLFERESWRSATWQSLALTSFATV